MSDGDKKDFADWATKLGGDCAVGADGNKPKHASAGSRHMKIVVGSCPYCNGEIIQEVLRRYFTFNRCDPDTADIVVVSELMDDPQTPTCEKCGATFTNFLKV
ncbi:MAG: hypothetical protein AAB874_04570 [Patescibacteria group bacterium]